MVFDRVTPVRTARIAVRPRSAVTRLGEGRGRVHAVVFGSADFAAAEVDESSLALGAAAAPPEAHPAGRPRDVDRDGFVDFVAAFALANTAVAAGGEACLSGTLRDGTRFRGCERTEAAHAQP